MNCSRVSFKKFTFSDTVLRSRRILTRVLFISWLVECEDLRNNALDLFTIRKRERTSSIFKRHQPNTLDREEPPNRYSPVSVPPDVESGSEHYQFLDQFLLMSRPDT
ncbi:hypothetical protein J6590_084183 [Homalodisca vitripennis]|nr:hypothetical protein J6590_084183 [Homalodisca vitripennis]